MPFSCCLLLAACCLLLAACYIMDSGEEGNCRSRQWLVLCAMHHALTMVLVMWWQLAVLMIKVCCCATRIVLLWIKIYCSIKCLWDCQFFCGYSFYTGSMINQPLESWQSTISLTNNNSTADSNEYLLELHEPWYRHATAPCDSVCRLLSEDVPAIGRLSVLVLVSAVRWKTSRLACKYFTLWPRILSLDPRPWPWIPKLPELITVLYHYFTLQNKSCRCMHRTIWWRDSFVRTCTRVLLLRTSCNYSTHSMFGYY
jgi:hypothetical protein